MAIRWKVPFVSITGDELCINIYDSGYSGAPTVLKGAPSPMMTSDDEGETLIGPSHASTGYVRVINEGGLTGIMPTGYLDRPVTLTSGATVLWQGYIQPQQFGYDMYLPHETVELPVSCMIGTLDHVDMDYKAHDMQMESFGELITEAVTAARGMTVTSVVFPKEWHVGSDYLAWARLAVNRNNWFEQSDSQNTSDADYEKYTTISYRTLLEKLSMQLGWAVSVHGNVLCFTSAGTSAYGTCALSALRDGGTVSDIAIGAISLHDLQHDSTQNQHTTLLGAKTVKVDAYANSINDLNVGISVANRPFVRSVNETLPMTDVPTMRSLIFLSDQQTTVLHAYNLQNSSFGEASSTEIAYNAQSDAGSINTQLVKADIYKQADADEKQKINYSYTEGVRVKFSLPTYEEQEEDAAHTVVEKVALFDPVPLLQIKGVNMPPQNSGCIDIGFSVKTLDGFIPPNWRVMCDLRIGSRTWNFGMKIENNHTEVNKTLDMDYEGASNYVIPINETVGGDVEFTIYGTNVFLSGGAGTILISGLELKYCNSEANAYQQTEGIATYSARATDSCGPSDESVTLSMATKTPTLKSGYGILYYGQDFATGGTPQFLSTHLCTEAALLEKLRRARFRTTSQLTPSLRCSAASAPQIGAHCTYGGKTYTVLALSRDWQQSSARLTMQEIINL